MSSVMTKLNVDRLKSLASDAQGIAIPENIRDTCTLFNNLSSYYFLTKRRKCKEFIPFGTLKTALEKTYKRRISKEGVFVIHLMCPSCMMLEFTCFHESIQKPSFVGISDFSGLKFQPDIISMKDKLKTVLLDRFHLQHRAFIKDRYLLQYRFYYNKKGEFIGKHIHPKYKLEEVMLFQNLLDSDTYGATLNSEDDYYRLFNLKDKIAELNYKNIVCKACILETKAPVVKKSKEIKGFSKTKIIKEKLKIKPDIKKSLEKEVGKNLATKIIKLEKDKIINNETHRAIEKANEILNQKELEIKINNCIIRIFTSEKKNCIEMQHLFNKLNGKIKGYSKQQIENTTLETIKGNNKFVVIEHLNTCVVNYRI
eukprot:GAHX01002188.1.p1 GENE.GAHX01002188.1~~GAHX01002188.1.p1  ORF type:complete len:369 (-),score=74.31 GAHX01002188.1:392-1498(-)